MTKQLNELLKELEETGKTFHVEFTKANGEFRKMDCRMGVKKHLKGGEATYKRNPKNVGVYESLRDSKGHFTDGQYRCFSEERVISIKVDGQVYKFQ